MLRNRRRSTQTPSKKLNDNKVALNSALRRLGRRDHSVKELRDKMSPWYETECIDFAISEVERMGYIKAPEELARLWSEQLGRQGRGRRRIKDKLRALGLPEVPKDDDREETKCRELIERRFGELNSPSYEEKTKIFRYLIYRGFETDIINKALNSLKKGNHD